MNKKLLSSVLACAAALTIGTAVVSAPCGPCTVPPPKTEGKQCPPPEFNKPPMTPEEHQKAMEAKKAEFDKRINLTDLQKTQLEKIKADEKKQLEPVHKKMQTCHEKMGELVKKENDIRSESMKKFEAVLTPEQKAEIEKMKKEFEPPRRPIECKGPKEPPKMMKPGCIPECKGPDASEPDCKCPCHTHPAK